jgi:hypothetical protein
MTVLGLKFQSSVSVLGVLRPYSKVPGETIHGWGLPARAPFRPPDLLGR